VNRETHSLQGKKEGNQPCQKPKELPSHSHSPILFPVLLALTRHSHPSLSFVILRFTDSFFTQGAGAKKLKKDRGTGAREQKRKLNSINACALCTVAIGNGSTAALLAMALLLLRVVETQIAKYTHIDPKMKVYGYEWEERKLDVSGFGGLPGKDSRSCLGFT
jgi:hypothetical protein